MNLMYKINLQPYSSGNQKNLINKFFNRQGNETKTTINTNIVEERLLYSSFTNTFYSVLK